MKHLLLFLLCWFPAAVLARDPGHLATYGASNPPPPTEAGAWIGLGALLAVIILIVAMPFFEKTPASDTTDTPPPAA